MFLSQNSRSYTGSKSTAMSAYFPFDVQTCNNWSVLNAQREVKRSCSVSILFDLAERLTFRDVQSPQEFRSGETAEVVCDVISSPVPVVVWYYQDREITEEHHSKFLPRLLSNVRCCSHFFGDLEKKLVICYCSIICNHKKTMHVKLL